MKKKLLYEAPEMEVIDVRVEASFMSIEKFDPDDPERDW